MVTTRTTRLSQLITHGMFQVGWNKPIEYIWVMRPYDNRFATGTGNKATEYLTHFLVVHSNKQTWDDSTEMCRLHRNMPKWSSVRVEKDKYYFYYSEFFMVFNKHTHTYYHPSLANARVPISMFRLTADNNC